MTQPTSDSTVSSIRRFFYSVEAPYGLAIIRIGLPLILLCVVIPRWSHSREFYSSDGATAQMGLNYGILDFLPEPSGTVAVAMMTALIFCLIASSIGWHTRIALTASWGLYTYLNMLDYLSTMTKYSVISSHLLLLLILSNCGAIWSVDRWRLRQRSSTEGTKRRSKTREELPQVPGLDGASNAATLSRRAPAWPRRLMQLFIGIVYFGAAFTKMHTDGFLNGDQIRFWLLTNMNGAKPIGEWLAMYPALIITMSHVALIWQVLFVFLCWRGRMRGVMLAIGATFHLATIWLLGLSIFPPIMLLSYCAWLNEEDVHRIRSWLRTLMTRLNPHGFESVARAAQVIGRGSCGLVTRSPFPSSVLFCVGFTAMVAGGVELEYRVDPYGQRRPEGPYILQPMSAERAAELFQSGKRTRDEDKFFAMEMGTDTLGGVVVHRSNSYQPGDRLIAQCALVPPHEDMWVVCRLTDDLGRQLFEVGQPVTRDMLRVNFFVQIPADLVGGNYKLVVNTNGNDVLSRNVRVNESATLVLSN